MHMVASGVLANSRCCFFELHLESKHVRLLPSTCCTDEYPEGNVPATLQLLGTDLGLLQTGNRRLCVPLHATSLALSVPAESTKAAGKGPAAPTALARKSLAEKRDLEALIREVRPSNASWPWPLRAGLLSWFC